MLPFLRQAGIHVVASHGPMIGENPACCFTHFRAKGFWAKGPAAELVPGFRVGRDAQRKIRGDGGG